ncbi:hypothetical protein AB0I81_10235 [Nonomuraea sp. NPDC050404]|uniref:hypothetical protein n=1 Tax=Nonomuraea sp. NPDC050404 TaxID=3155783 RepID=UPI0033FB8E87
MGVDRLVKPHEGWARCGIGAKFRVVLACKTSASATDATKYNGPWVMPPGTSRAACPSAKPYIAEAGFERDS